MTYPEKDETAVTTVIDHLGADVINITQEELKLLGQDPHLTGSIVVKEWGVKGDPRKRQVELKSFTYKPGKTKEKLGIRSTVEFHFEVDLWIPRRLELCLDVEPPKLFLCEVTREEEGFRYGYEVRMIK